MKKTGRPPKPTALKLLTGNPGRRPISKDVQPKAGVPKCPDWLGEIGKQYWAEAVDALPIELVTLADGHFLALYCDAWEQYHSARKVVHDEGMVAESEKGGAYQHPAVGIMNKARDAIRKFGGLFGMSPSDRVGLHPGGDEEKDDDPLVAMMRLRAGRN